MKKLLAMLTSINTIGSIMPMILANAPRKIENNNLQVNNLKRNKQELSTNDYLEFNNKYIEKIKEINNNINKSVKDINVDSKNNNYFLKDNGAYVLKQGETTPTKINNISLYLSEKIKLFVIDKEDNVYFGTDNGAYVLKFGETTATKINNLNKEVNWIVVDNNNDIYIEYNKALYLKKSGDNLAVKILEGNISHLRINKNNNIYFLLNDYFYIIKKGNFFKKEKRVLQQVTLGGFDNNDNYYFLRSPVWYEHPDIYFLNENLDEIKKDFPINTVWPVLLRFNKNNDLYFSVNDDSLYLLKHGETTATKINETTNFNWQNDLKFDSKNNIYYSTNNAVYMIKHGETTATKINEINESKITKIAIDNNDNLYFIANHSKIFVLKQNDKKIIKIKDANNIYSIAFDSKNNIYYSTNDAVYMIKHGETTATKINEINESKITKIAIDNNDNLYVVVQKDSTDDELYVLYNNYFVNIWKGHAISNILFDKQNNLYLYGSLGASYPGTTVLKYDSLSEIIKITNLEKIENNDDETILNILNYLNRESNYFLNLNKMKVINKTPTSATIVATKGKYRGEVNITYKIKNKAEINNIDLNDLVKKVVYFDFIDRNFYSFAKIKEIKEININNLSFGNVEVTRDSELLHSINFKEECFKKRERTNISPVIKTVKIPKCDYDSKSKLVFQITTGLTKTKQENKLNGWNINSDDEMKLTDFTNINNKNSEIVNVLSNEFDLSNINKQEQEMIFYSFSDVEDEIDLAPHERIIIKYSVREIHLENTLNLKQKITETITVKIIDDNNEEQTIILSIKEAMQILQKYSLLPDEITINEDNSITFNGKAKISLTQEGEPKLIINTSIV